MKGKRRRSRNRSSKQKLPHAAQVIGFSEQEEAFFRAGEAEDGLALAEIEEIEVPRVSWLTRFFAIALPA